MRHIESKSEYDAIVQELAEQHSAEIEDGLSRSLANAVVGGFGVVGGEPTVHTAAHWRGVPVEFGGSATAVDPHDVIKYSEVDLDEHPDPTDGHNWADQAAHLATHLLAIDMIHAEADERDE